ncbi:MAG: DUF1579 family protein [bacterium]
MKRNGMALLLLGALLLLSLSAVAQEAEEAAMGMPAMGPTQEIQDLKWLIGTWDVKMESKMTPDQPDWIPSTGVVVYEYAAGGAAIKFTYKADEMMGMVFEGIGLQTFDRETGRWQMVWADNMGARISYYTGEKSKDGRTVLEGDEIFGGQSYKGRIISFNETPSSFEWQMDNSMDNGQTWWTGGKAIYTKHK